MGGGGVKPPDFQGFLPALNLTSRDNYISQCAACRIFSSGDMFPTWVGDLCPAFGEPPISQIEAANEAGKMLLLGVTDDISSTTSEALTNAACLPCEVSLQVGVPEANN